MKSDFEILDIFIDEFGMCEELKKLTYLEQVLYKCQLRNTLSFSLYLCRYRILEFSSSIMKKIAD